jgi:hypothetical protein
MIECAAQVCQARGNVVHRLESAIPRRQACGSPPNITGDSASVPGSQYGLGIFFVPLSCGGGYWSHEGDVPGYNTIGAVSSDGRTTVVLSINSNVDDPVLAAEYRLIDHVMCTH